jgi:ABC-type antimicrobial peptide transport system permease subunit
MSRSILMRAVAAQLGRYKTKTALMAAGIALGVLAMVAIQALAVSMRAGFGRYVAFAYPAEVVVLAAGDPITGGTRGRDALRLDDVAAVRAAIPEILEWDPVVRAGWRDVKRAGNDTRVPIFGYSEKVQSIRRRGVREGEFFDGADVDGRARVLLLGSTTAQRLFGTESAVGAELFVDSLPFVVKGVLEPVGMDPHGIDLDQTAWMPFTTAMDGLLGIDYLSEAALSIADPARAENVAVRIQTVMRERHAIPQGYEDDFTVVTAQFVRDRLNRSFDTIELFVALIVGVLFAIAAVIVASVLSIAMKQRAPEIGLRKALGARRLDLAVQVGLEVLAVSLIAAVAGLAAAYGILTATAPLLAAQFGMTGIELAPGTVLLALAAAAATALVGAALPVIRAARLDPVEALR